ncbi:hypothetical protein Dsin_026588 [Dipteronia sinensis]|uniref:Protein ECERIFERUM 1-like n=1 Tax=Dipteronia sinensis TaxID=43782 RepID=A0AAD9ZZC9_9ROSI|nr:hypothetical protein Dsin_026588 [Dipteronia sinensis]
MNGTKWSSINNQTNITTKHEEEFKESTDMASKPGIFSDWPWKPLGSYKYVVLAPWVVHSIYSYTMKEETERDLTNFLIFPFMLWRILHNQIWITLSRYRTSKGNNLIVDKSIDFDQVDRESNWDDQIILHTLLSYIISMSMAEARGLPFWRTDGVVKTILLHMGPVEFLYYWFHRALHHHYLYSRYHSHHHSSTVTQPISAVIHPFAEMVVYFMLFGIPLITTLLTGTASMAVVFGYLTYIDFMNNMGHCNFELIPNCLFSVFPPLKYLMYTPSFHSLHHTQFRTNYSLFMPFYDYIYDTMDKSTDRVYETSLKRAEDLPDVVHLTHLTKFESIYHLRLGFSSLASNPDDDHQNFRWYMWVMRPFTICSAAFTWIYGRTFVSDRHTFDEKLRMQTWMVPRYNIQYFLKWQRDSINRLIEEAILKADKKGVKGEEVNRNGEMYIKRNPKLKVKVVDGSSLAVAIVLNSIPPGTKQVVLRAKLSKVVHAIAFALCQTGIQVAVLHEEEHMKLQLSSKCGTNLVLTKSYHHSRIWVVGDGLTEEEQNKASKGTIFIPFSQFPLKKIRQDCFYHTTPAMIAPPSLNNLHSCENWLPRRVMSAWRVAGIVHAMEEWNVNECGDTIFNIDTVWQAALRHGFRPLPISY